jgi:hypothetical protein
MFVICIVEDEWTTHRPDILRSARLHSADAQYCVLRVAYQADSGEVREEPILDLFDQVKACWESTRAGLPAQLVVNETCHPLEEDTTGPEPPRGLTAQATALTLLALLQGPHAGQVRSSWFFACDARLEDKLARWPVEGIAEAALFDALLRDHKRSVVREVAQNPYHAWGLFCAWLLRRHEMKSALVTSRFAEEDTQDICSLHILKPPSGWNEAVFLRASRELGKAQKTWVSLADNALEQLAQAFTGYQKLDAAARELHRLKDLLSRLQKLDPKSDGQLLTLLASSAARGKSILESLGCTDQDITEAITQSEGQSNRALAQVLAKAKAVAYRERGEVFLFDLLHHARRAHDHPVTINGQPAESLFDFKPLIDDELRIEMGSVKETREVFNLLASGRGRLQHEVESADGRLSYWMVSLPTGPRDVQVDKLLYGQGETASLLRCMRILCQDPRCRLKPTDKPVALIDGECTPEALKMLKEGVSLFVWPDGEAYNLALAGLKKFHLGAAP